MLRCICDVTSFEKCLNNTVVELEMLSSTCFLKCYTHTCTHTHIHNLSTRQSLGSPQDIKSYNIFWYLVLSGMTFLRGEAQEPPNLQNKRHNMRLGFYRVLAPPHCSCEIKKSDNIVSSFIPGGECKTILVCFSVP